MTDGVVLNLIDHDELKPASRRAARRAA